MSYANSGNQNWYEWCPLNLNSEGADIVDKCQGERFFREMLGKKMLGEKI